MKTMKLILYIIGVVSLMSLAMMHSGCNGPKPGGTDLNKDKNFNPQTVKIFMTAPGDSVKLKLVAQPTFTDNPQPDEHHATIFIDPSVSFQKIVGIGGAITDAAAETFYKLPKEKQDELINAYFTDEKGINYSLCRTHINSCDFSSESYAYSDENDKDLNKFSIEHDMKYRIPLIKAALAASNNQMRMFASPWSPPAWMKDNNNMLKGGKLLSQYMQTWADYFVKFIDEYKKQGIDFWGVTVQNEPMAVQTWESCIYTAEDERDFVKKYLGPTINKSKYKDTKIIIWDHNRGLMQQRAKIVYDDPEASKYVWGMGFHWYTGDHFDNVRQVADAYPDKKLLFTEGCVYPFNLDSINEWHWGETYGKSLIMDLNNGASGWVDWNIILDETGGPNHVNNYCFAPVIANTKTGEVHYMNSFYFLGHFSKFIRPGAKRIACTSNDDALIATSFKNEDKSVVTVVQNLSSVSEKTDIWVNGKSVPVEIPAHSIISVVFK